MMKKVLFALIALFSFVSTWAEDAPQVDVATQQVVIGTGDDAYTVILSTKYVALPAQGGVDAPEILSITKGEDPLDYDPDDVLIFVEDEGDAVPFTKESITEEGKYFLVVPFEEANYNKLLYVPFYVIEPWDGWTRVNNYNSFEQQLWGNGAYGLYYYEYPWCDVWYQTGQNPEDGVILYPGNTISPTGGEVDRSYYIYGDNTLSDEEKDAAAKLWANNIIDYQTVYHSWYATQQSNPDNIVFSFEPMLAARVVNDDPEDWNSSDNVFNGEYGTCRVVTVYNDAYKMPWGANTLFGGSAAGAKRYGVMSTAEAKAPSTDEFDESKFAMLLVPSYDAGSVETVVDFSKSVDVVVFDDVPYNGQNTAAEVYSVTWTAEDDAKDEVGNDITEGDVLAPDQYYIAGYLQAEDVDVNGEYDWDDIKEYPSHVGQWRALVAYGAEEPEVGECANDGSIWNYGEDGMMYVGYAVSNEFTVNPAPLEMRLSQITPHFGQKNIKAKYAVKPEYYKLGDDDTNVIIINEEYKGETVNGKYGETAEWYYGDDFGKWWNDPKFNKFDKVNGAAAFDITDADRYSTLGVSVSEYTINSALAHPCTVIDGKVYENYYIAAVTDAQCRIIANKVTITVPGQIGKMYGNEDPNLNWGITVIDEAGQDMTADDYSYDADDEDRQDNPKVTVVISREVATDGSNIENVGKYKIYVDLMGSDAKNYEVKAKTSKAIKEGGVTVGYRYEYEQAFEIWQRNLNDPNVIIDIADYKYNGKNQQVEPKEDKGVLFYDEFNVFKDADDNYADGYSADNYYVDADGKGYVILKKDIDWVIADGGAQKEAADAAVGAYWNNNKVQRKADGTVDTKKGICDIEAVFEGAGADKTYTRNFKNRKAGNFTITPLTLVLKVKDAETAFGSTPTYELEVVTTDTRNEGFITDPEETFTTADVQLVAPNVVFSGYTAGNSVSNSPYTITAALAADVNRVVVSRNYEPIFENGELTVNPFEVALVAENQEDFYPQPNEEVYATPDATKGYNGGQGTWDWVKTDVDVLGVVTPSVPLPEYIKMSDLVELTCDVTKVNLDADGNVIANPEALVLRSKNNPNVTITSMTNGNLTIKPLTQIHLSYDNVAQALEDHKGVTMEKVYLADRRIKEDQWYAMVLPFEIDIPKFFLKSGADEGYPKLYFGSVARLDKENNSGNVSFKTTVADVPANEPFLFQLAKDPDLNQADAMTAVQLSKVYVENKKIGDGTFVYNDKDNQPKVSDGKNDFIGTYVITQKADGFKYTKTSFVESEAFVSRGDGKFYKGDTDVNKAHKLYVTDAYVSKVDGSSYAGVRFIIENEEGTVTAIEGIGDSADDADASANGFAEGWYTINGIKLEGEPTTTGTYIYNGKKVFIQK